MWQSWLNARDSKSRIRGTVSGVRTPPSPPEKRLFMNKNLHDIIFSIYEYFGKDREKLDEARSEFYRIGEANPRVALMLYRALLTDYINQKKKKIALADTMRIYLIVSTNADFYLIHPIDALSMPEADKFYETYHIRYPRSSTISKILINMNRFDSDKPKGKLDFKNKLRVKYTVKDSNYPHSFNKRMFLLNKNRISKDTVYKKLSGLNKFFIAQAYKKYLKKQKSL